MPFHGLRRRDPEADKTGIYPALPQLAARGKSIQALFSYRDGSCLPDMKA